MLQFRTALAFHRLFELALQAHVFPWPLTERLSDRIFRQVLVAFVPYVPCFEVVRVVSRRARLDLA